MALYNKILLVDDDPIQTIILQAYFAKLDCQAIIEANNAKKALEILQERTDIDLIVSDLMMPDMDGMELLRALKSIGFSGKIALVSSLEQAILNSARKLGELHQLQIIGTCRKPLNRQSLDDVFQAPALAARPSWRVPRHQTEHVCVTRGLDEGLFIPYYQPKVDVRTGRIIGVEALARWQHWSKSLLTPDVFMPVIYESRLTGMLTFCLLDHVLRDMAQWKRSGLEFKVAINITAREVADLSFPDRLREKLKQSGIAPSLIALEITENEVLEFNATSLEVLSRLRMLGIDIAIDDFGTGYSNLKALREFPYTELKIDQSFIRGMAKDSFSQESVRTAATLGRQLNMRLLAEGVETAEEWEFVKQRGIDEIQGYYVAKPMPAADFLNFYSKKNGYAMLDGDSAANSNPPHVLNRCIS